MIKFMAAIYLFGNKLQTFQSSKKMGCRHVPSNQKHMKSKHAGYDKSGAWPMHVNFQPWQKTPATLGASSIHGVLV
jgi:hypothetical protein